MTSDEHAALESLRDEPDDHTRFERSTPWLIATLVVVALAIFIALGYLAVSTHTIAENAATTASNTQTLLKNGKTASAVSAKKTEQLAEEIKGLIENGKTAGALASQRAAESAAKGNVILNKALTLLVGNIKTNRANGLVTRQILCAAARDTHPTDVEIQRLCATK